MTITASPSPNLADDKLLGRKPGTAGYRWQSDYVVNEFKQMGVKPAEHPGHIPQKLICWRNSKVDNTKFERLNCLIPMGTVAFLGFWQDFLPYAIRWWPMPRTWEAGFSWVYGGGWSWFLFGYDGIRWSRKSSRCFCLAGVPRWDLPASTLFRIFGSAGIKLKYRCWKTGYWSHFG